MTPKQYTAKLEKIVALATKVFHSEKAARIWLKTKCDFLLGGRPIEYISKDDDDKIIKFLEEKLGKRK